ncbi:MAG: right-handed parallel beta-helix repeat-containing protein [Krumholzibacteria bacterium]|nr:right-handed parallel beta-helix repeat-containing protein [Candidatus Krumholzibacteria bacterium]
MIMSMRGLATLSIIISAISFFALGGASPRPADAAFWDATFGMPGMDGDNVHALVEYAGGVVACGEFTTAGGAACNRIAFWDGEGWSPLGTGLNDRAIHMAVIGSDLYVGGLFTSADDVPGTAYIARWDGVAWHAVGSGFNNYVFGLGEFEGQLVAGGQFTMAGATAVNSVAIWDGLAWQPLGDGLTVDDPVASVWCFEVFNGELVAGGRFTRSGSTVVNRVARWDGAQWLPLGTGVSRPDGVTSVYDLAVYADDLIVGGLFQDAGGSAIDNLARWDGSAWYPMVPGGFEGTHSNEISALGLYRGDLLVGGRFDALVGVPETSHVARWNGIAWSGLGGGANSDVDDFLAVEEGVIVSGWFTQVGSVPANHVARWVDLTAWHVATDGDDTWPGTESRPFQTIARGIAVAATGDTVLIHDGTYTGPGNRDLTSEPKNISIRSVSGIPEACIIDAEFDSSGSGWIMSFPSSGWDPVLDITGLTFSNGAAGGIQMRMSASGMGGSADLGNCRFLNCGVGYTARTNGEMTNCYFENCNVGYELTGEYPDWFTVIRNCTFVDCGTGYSYYTDYSLNFEDCVFADNNYGYSGGGSASFVRCEFYGNKIAALSGPGWGFGTWWTFVNCFVHDNPGDGIVFNPAYAAWLMLQDTKVVNNGGTGVLATVDFQARMYNCIIAGNGGVGLDLTAGYPHDPISIIVENCTVAENGGGGILIGQPYESATINVSNAIIAFNTGEGLADHSATYTNCVVYGNGADDLPDSWQPGVAGNIAKDPLFCDPAAGDYGLAANSPCAPSALHGLIGALGVACAGIPAPVLLSVADVPQDQGGQVRLTWYRSGHDEAGSAFPILGYDVYRRADAKAVAGRDAAGKLLGWDYLLRLPARGDQGYQVVAPTFCDSTITGGLCESVFLVSAVTADPLVFFDSSPDSGWSTDDLAPGVPAAVTAAYQQAGVALDWADAPEADFQHFRIYRATDPGFVPTPDALVHQTGASAWTDPSPNPWGNHYKVTAVDAAGNESAPGQPAGMSGVETGAVPPRTALLGATPNPFNPTTTLSFALAVPGHARLRIYDAAGRLVATLVDGQRGAGRHEQPWHGRDDEGRAVASGVYLYRFEAGGYTETRRMALVR